MIPLYFRWSWLPVWLSLHGFIASFSKFWTVLFYVDCSSQSLPDRSIFLILNKVLKTCGDGSLTREVHLNSISPWKLDPSAGTVVCTWRRFSLFFGLYIGTQKEFTLDPVQLVLGKSFTNCLIWVRSLSYYIMNYTTPACERWPMRWGRLAGQGANRDSIEMISFITFICSKLQHLWTLYYQHRDGTVEMFYI